MLMTYQSCNQNIKGPASSPVIEHVEECLCSSWLESRFFHLWFLKLPITRRSSPLRQLPGDREVSEAVPAQSSAGRRWNPSGCRAWGARRGGDSHLQSPSAWVSSLQRATQGRPRLFIRTFKGCYITRLNELFNGKDSSEPFCLTGWFMREVQP